MVNSRYSSIIRSGLVALFVAALAGCGGGGSDGVDDGGGVVVPVTGLPSPDVSAPVSAAAVVAGNDTATSPTVAFSVLQNAGLPIASTASPLKVNFTVFSNGAVKTGLALSNVSFAIAKLVPGTNGAPDQWVNYIYRTESTASAPNNVGPDGEPVLASALQATTDAKPTAMAATQLVYNSQGYYTYTFATDIRDPAFVGNNLTTNGVTFEPTRTHRIAIQLSYTNTAGETVRVNPYYDFKFVAYTEGCTNADGCYYAVPLTNPATETRIMADVKSCNTCHNNLALHGGGRVDVQFCVMCHTEGTVDANSGNMLDMRNMVHKIHAGHMLKYGYSIWGYGSTEHDYSHVGFPQDLRNCNKCHSNTPAEGNPYQTAQGDNWKAVPSRRACGSCHDGIDFTKPFGDGNGTTLNPDLPWATYGHVGGEQADDSQCATCHSAAAIGGVYHIPVTAAVSGTAPALTTTYYAANDNRLPAGAHTVDYDIQSVSINGSRNPVMVFRILQDGARMDLNTATSTSDTAIWSGFYGAPSIYFAYSIPQDGVATPADFNAYVNTSLLGIWNGSGTTTNAGTLTGPDSNGYYTVTMTGRTIPADASLLTGAMGYAAMYQTNVPGYERTCGTAPCVNGLNVTAEDKSKAATGFTARRITAEADRCNNCHGKLGLFTETTFHSGQRNDPKMCAMCHNPNRSSSGWSADSTAFVHGIHGASKRTVSYNWHSTVYDAAGVSQSSSTLLSAIPGYTVSKFGDIGFPGILSNCENCHAPGGYDFSAGLSQVQNRLHRTAAQGTMAAAGTVGSLSLSPYVTAGTAYGTASTSNCNSVANCNQPNGNLVNSPIANACFGCHDGQTTADPSLSVEAHIESNGGGSIYLDRATALTKQESCMLCHGPTQLVPIKSSHGL